MSTLAATSPKAAGMTKDERFVIFASSLGTVFEWYDFYLFGSLAGIIGAQFFGVIDPATNQPMFTQATRDIFALLAFAAGFIVRPFGAIVFGRVGDIVGRKYTFLVTILIMGLSTFIVGILPNAATIGIAAPIILIVLRLLQGLALGGEYGGAATYVAEHSPQGKRGYYTSFIQTTATLGLFLSLLVILFTRSILGEPEFAAWGWRVPFLVSVVLLGISVWIRLRLNESPVFQKMKDEGKGSKSPLTESFGNWSNAKIVLIALLGAVMGQGVVWYTGQFYALFFMQSILKVDGYTANLLIAWSLLLGTGFFIFWGALSDKIGRKPIILAGCLIAALTFFPIFRMITTNANPTLEKAIESVKVEVVSDPALCGDLFNPVGTRRFTTPCDTARAYLAQQSVKYSTSYGPAGSGVKVNVNGTAVPYTAPTSNPAVLAAVQAAGYPKVGDAQIVKMTHPFDIFRPQVAAVIGLL
ncbi:MAG: MFS transporter, partial [Tardiphaga sp.]